MTPSLDWVRLDALLRDHPLGELAELASAGHPLVLVGGAVRDALLGSEVRDLDLVVDGDLEPVIDAIAQLRGRRPAAIGDVFQETHRFLWRGRSVDVTRAQGDLEADLGRRDFTINALGVPLAPDVPAVDRLVDPHGGLEDLASRALVPVAAENIAADPLRVLRGARYAGTLSLARDEGVRMVLAAAAPALDGVANERVVAEWQRILEAEGWDRAVAAALDSGALAATLGPAGRLAAVPALAAAESDGEISAAEGGVALRFAALLYDVAPSRDARQLEERLRGRRWSRSLARTVSRAAVWARNVDEGDTKLARRAIESPQAARIAGSLATVVGETIGDKLKAFAERAEEPRWIGGAELRELGLADDPAMGGLLAQAAEGQVARRWSCADAALAWAAEQVAG